jgi:uncharacterized protein (DUF2141 family)
LLRRLLLPAALFVSLTAQSDGADIEIQIQGLRNTDGVVRLCMTRDQAFFPNCADDREAVKATVSASQAGSMRLRVVPGIYALSVIHDANSNGRLDRTMGVPRESFGFSRNPRIRMGAPTFEEVRFRVGAGGGRAIVQMKHLL